MITIFEVSKNCFQMFSILTDILNFSIWNSSHLYNFKWFFVKYCIILETFKLKLFIWVDFQLEFVQYYTFLFRIVHFLLFKLYF